MALSMDKLNKIGGQSLKGNAPQVFTYDNGAGDTVTAAGFFNKFAPLLGVGDLIIVVNYSSSKPATAVIYTVASIEAGVVTVAAALS